MSLSLYEVAIPPLVRGLKSLSAVLAKGEASATARKIAPEVLLQSRLAPDMYALARQVQKFGLNINFEVGHATMMGGVAI